MEKKATSSKRKHSIKKPLENKTFYLDLKMYPQLDEERLVKNLTLLGAKKDPVFSKCVSFVVSNNESLKSASGKPFKMPPKPQNWTPLTPITNTTCQSPLFNESSMDYLNSPPYANSPATDHTPVPLCRGMAILQKATLKKQPQYTTDLIEKCKQLNVKVLHVDNVVAEVEKLKNKFKVYYVSEKRRTHNGERKLKPPFMKVEDIKLGKRSWTWHQEFPSTTFNTKLADQVKELYNHFKKSGNIQVAVKPVFGELKPKKGFPLSPMAQPPVFPPTISKSFSKFSDTTAKPSTAFSVCNVKRKLEEQPPEVSKKQKMYRYKKKKLYCEICKVNFVNLDKHLECDTHRMFLSDPMNFLEVQNIITSFPKKEDFIMSRSLTSNVVQTCDLAVDYSCLPVDNVQVNPQEYPTTYGASAGSHFYATQQPPLAPVLAFGDVDTEPYCLMEEDNYVSPSCTSPESRNMPFLHDSTDGLDGSTPLNLSKRENNVNHTPLGAGMSLKTSPCVGASFSMATPEFLKSLNGVQNAVKVYDDPLIAYQTEMGINVENFNSFPIVRDSKLGQESYYNLYESSQVVSVAVKDNIPIVTMNERTTKMLQISKSFHQYDKCPTFPMETFTPETVPDDQTSVIYKNDIIDTEVNNIALLTVSFTEANISTSAPLENVLPTETELIAVPPKIKPSSNDSGFGTQNSPPPLALCSSPKEHTSALKPDECCALDLSAAKENHCTELPSNINSLKEPSSDRGGSMPDLSIIEVDASVSTSECMPLLVPVCLEEGPKADTYVAQNDEQNCSQTPSLPEFEHVCQEQESKENMKFAQDSSPLPCVPDVHDKPVCNNFSMSTYSQVHEDASKFCYNVNVVPTSSTSVYDLVEEADFSDNEEEEWGNIHSDVNNLCDSFCREEGNVDMCVN